MIQNIQIKDFRGIQEGRLGRFAKFNLLIGPNNSGKSALMEALYLATTAGRRAALADKRTNAVYNVTVPDDDLLGYRPLSRVWRKHSFAERQSSLGRWRDGQVVVRIRDSKFPLNTFDLSTGGEGFAQDEEEVIGLVGIEGSEANREQGVESVVEAMMGPDALPLDGKRLVFLWHSGLTYYGRGRAAWLVEGDLPSAQRVLFFDAGMLQEHLPLAFYQPLPGTIPGWANRIARHFGAIFDIPDPQVLFTPPTADSRWVQGRIGPRDGLLMPVDGYGDGARFAFKVLTPLVTLAELIGEDSPGLFLWEEPELCQHPQTLERLLKTVVQIVRGHPLQVFLSTHSLEVIGYFTRLLQESLLGEEELVTFRLDLDRGTLRSSRFEPRHLLAWLDDGLDPRVWEPLYSPVRYRLREERP